MNELPGEGIAARSVLLCAGPRMTAMKELATDIAIVIGPAGVVYCLIGDPWIAVLWSIVGLSFKWYQRHLQQPPYSDSDKGDAAQWDVRDGTDL
jgi:hypothetical protein